MHRVTIFSCPRAKELLCFLLTCKDLIIYCSMRHLQHIIAMIQPIMLSHPNASSDFLVGLVWADSVVDDTVHAMDVAPAGEQYLAWPWFEAPSLSKQCCVQVSAASVLTSLGYLLPKGLTHLTFF